MTDTPHLDRIIALAGLVAVRQGSPEPVGDIWALRGHRGDLKQPVARGRGAVRAQGHAAEIAAQGDEAVAKHLKEVHNLPEPLVRAYMRRDERGRLEEVGGYQRLSALARFHQGLHETSGESYRGRLHLTSGDAP